MLRGEDGKSGRRSLCRDMLLFFVLGVLSLAGRANSPRPPWMDARYIERSFYDIALQAEYRREEVPPVVKRWAGPLRVWMHSGAGNAAEQAALLRKHLGHLADITRLRVEFVNRARDANVRVFFAADRELGALARQEMPSTAERVLDKSVCIGSIRYNRHAEITGATVLIPVQRAQAQGKLSACVVEEVTQMLGLINDSDRVRHTVFSDVTDDDQLTPLDYLLIRLLYSPYLRNGMTAREAAPLVRHQLRVWQMNGEFYRAERAAGSLGLRLAGR